jgi:Flp pilus assembly protein TadG
VAVELVLLVPLLVVLLLVVAYAGRVTRAQTLARQAADAGARAASLRQSPGAAAADARASALANLSGAPVSCTSPVVLVDTSQLHPGGWVSVEVRCRSAATGLGGLGLPGRTVSARSFELVDQRRGG